MNAKEKNFKGVWEIDLEPRLDQRGFFMRVYDEIFFKKNNLHRQWVQENHSLSLAKNIIRGMHFQFPPYSETKLVRCIHGTILDAYVDLRKNSPTFGKWDSLILSAENKKVLFLPKGFAHGFCTLTENCEITYKVDSYYTPEFEGIIKWNDPDIGIIWPVKEPIISEKDANAQGIKKFIEKYHWLDI